MHHNTDSIIGGGAQAFAWGVARHRMRRQAYVEAVIEGRERDALQRRIRSLEAQVVAQTRQAVDRRVRTILTNLPG